MDKAAVLTIIEHFRKALESKGVHVLKIVLLGSYSSSTFHEGSDIDLVVISEDFAPMGLWNRIQVLAAAISDAFYPIEVFAKTPDEWEKGDSLIVHFAKIGRRRTYMMQLIPYRSEMIGT